MLSLLTKAVKGIDSSAALSWSITSANRGAFPQKVYPLHSENVNVNRLSSYIFISLSSSCSHLPSLGMMSRVGFDSRDDVKQNNNLTWKN